MISPGITSESPTSTPKHIHERQKAFSHQLHSLLFHTEERTGRRRIWSKTRMDYELVCDANRDEQGGYPHSHREPDM